MNFFLIGMRRSGTSIARTLLLKHPKIKECLFEPYELWHSIRVSHLGRYRNDPYVKKIIQDFRNTSGKYKGAKFALNTCLEAMTWKRLHLVFPDAKFIFIDRNVEETWASWNKADKDSVRGLCSKTLYKGFRNQIVNSFYKFNEDNACSAIVKYDNILVDADKELEKVWECFGIDKINGLNKFIKTPENRVK